MNSNPNTPVAGLVERLRALIPIGSITGHSDFGLVNPDGPEAASRIEQLEADKRALVADLREIETEGAFIGQSSDAYAAEKGLRIQRIVREVLATISNPSPVKGAE